MNSRMYSLVSQVLVFSSNAFLLLGIQSGSLEAETILWEQPDPVVSLSAARFSPSNPTNPGPGSEVGDIFISVKNAFAAFGNNEQRVTEFDVLAVPLRGGDTINVTNTYEPFARRLIENEGDRLLIEFRNVLLPGRFGFNDDYRIDLTASGSAGTFGHSIVVTVPEPTVPCLLLPFLACTMFRKRFMTVHCRTQFA